MQPTGGFLGNAPNRTVQQQQALQMQQMYQQQYGQALPHMQQPNTMTAQQQAYGMQQQQPQQQYAMPGAAMAAMQRPASATPPGLPQQQPSSAAAGNAPRQSADGADGGDFDFDNIPSPTASPAGAGAGPAPAQQQPQQPLPFPGGQGAMGQAVHIAQQQQQQQQLSLQHQQQLQRQQQQAQQQRAREEAMKAHHAMMQQQGPVAGRGPAAAAPAAQRVLPGGTPGMTSAQAALASADAAAAKSKKGPIVVGPPGALGRPPGVDILQAGALGLQQHHLQQQQQQHQAQQQLADAAKKRKRADSLLLPPPEDALSVEAVFARARMASGTAALAGLPGMPPSVAAAAAAGGAGTDGPSLSVDEILRRPEYQRGAAAAAAGRPGLGGAAGLKAGRGRDGRRDDDSRVLPESHLRRLMELQGLNKAFRMQPELQEQLTKLTEAFVSEAVDFGCALAARRRGATLRPSDLALFMQRSHHIYVPGFNKEYRQYKRPVPSELHKARTVLVRKAQLHPQPQAAAVAGDGAAAGGKAGGVRFSGAE